MPEKPFRYDVAFSFLSRDEALADKLNGLVKERLSTFFYPEQQRILAGSNGEVALNRAFGLDSRVVAILYRPEWGETPFTRVESTAISNRVLAEGYDFALFIMLEGTSAPPWFPKNRIWTNIERFGVESAAAIIEERVKDRGGLVRSETAEEKAARLVRDTEADSRRTALLWQQGGELAKKDLARVFDAIQAITDQVDASLGLVFQKKARACLLSWKNHSVVVEWDCPTLNLVKEAELRVTLQMGLPFLTTLQAATWKPPRVLRRVIYKYDVSLDGRGLWRENRQPDQGFPNEALADVCVKMLLDKIEHEMKAGRR
jgi:hypothetical protein